MRTALQILHELAVGTVAAVLVRGLCIVGSVAEGDEEYGTHIGRQAEALNGLGGVEVTHGTGTDAQVSCLEKDVGEDDRAVNVAIAAILATLAGSLFIAAYKEGMGSTIHAGTEGVGLGYGVFGTKDINLLGLAVDGCGGQFGSLEDEVNLLLLHRSGGEVTYGITVSSKLQEIFCHGCFCLGLCGCGFFGDIVAGTEAEHQRQGGDEKCCFHFDSIFR